MMRTAGLLILTLSLLVVFQNCGDQGFMAVRDLSSSGVTDGLSAVDGDCEDLAFEEFEKTFYKTFQDYSCYNCHSNSLLLNFADQDINVAFDHFSTKAPSHFAQKFISGTHQDIGLGANEAKLILDLETHGQNFEDNQLNCKNVLGQTHESSTRKVSFFDVDATTIGGQGSECFFNDPIKLSYVEGTYSVSNPKRDVLEWDLGAEDPRLSGLIARLEVAVEKPSVFPPSSPQYACPNEDGYQVGHLRFVSSTKRFKIRDVQIRLNGDDQNDRHFYGIDIEVGPGTGEVYMLGPNAGFTLFNKVNQAVTGNDEWSLYFEDVQVLP